MLISNELRDEKTLNNQKSIIEKQWDLETNF